MSVQATSTATAGMKPDAKPVDQMIRLHLSGERKPGEREPYSGERAPAFNRTLSIALAMKGGVSLAVWIGGAVSEIDLLRRIRIVTTPVGPEAYFLADPGTLKDPLPGVPEYDRSRKKPIAPAADPGFEDELHQTLVRADRYAQILRSRGYDSVDVDVLAGASAGGLNAVLYGVAQRAGVSVDSLLTTWTDAGSAWRLLRTPGLRAVASVLQGDDFFWPQVRQAIEGFYALEGNELARAQELTVDLSATISDHEYLTSAGSHEGRGHFHFVGADDEAIDGPTTIPGVSVSTGRNIPTADDPESTARLAYAARTTSSFPGAFEQARIFSHQAAVDEFGPSDTVDMSFAFSAHRSATPPAAAVPFQVLDGGVLDNIPIDRLTRAIRDRTPRAYGDRIAIYLDPSPDALPLSVRMTVPSSPPVPEPANDTDRGKQSFLATVGNGIFMRGIRESAGDEIAGIDDLRQAALYETARAGSFAQSARPLTTLPTGASGFDLALARRTQYVLYRAVSDSDLWKRVLGYPDLWQLTTDLATRHHWPTADDRLLRTLDGVFSATYDALAAIPGELGTGPIFSGSQGLRDAALCALDWMRDLEDVAHAGGTTVAFEAERDELRQSIHQIARQALRLRDQRTRDVLNTPGAIQSPSDLIGQWLLVSPDNTALDQLWADLGVRVERLRAFTAELQPLTSDSWGSPWRWFPSDADAYALAPFIAAEGIPDTVQVEQFAQISADEATPYENDFSPLTVAQRAGIVSGWLALPGKRFDTEAKTSELTPLTLDPGAKLAGSILGNFGAFFSRAWRVNDWWWGRLDATAGIVRVLSSLPGDARNPIAADSTAVLQGAILHQTAVAAEGNRPFKAGVELKGELPSALAAHMSAGAHSLAQLRPAYLVSVASRVVRIAVRALRSGQNPIIGSALKVVLPPLLSAVPMVFTPLRLVFVISALFALLPWAAQTPPQLQPVSTTAGAFPGWILFAVALAIAVFPLSGVVTSVVRISTLKRQQGGTTVLCPLANEIFRSRLLGIALSVICLVALGVLAWRNAHPYAIDASGVFLALAAIVAAFAARKASRTLARREVFLENVVFLLLTGLAIWAIFEPNILGGFVAMLDAFGRAMPLGVNMNPVLVVAVGVGLVQAVLSWGWLGGVYGARRRWYLILWIAAVGIVGIAAGATVYGISLTQAGQAIPGFVTGLAVWFVASQLGWWIGELPIPLVGDIDDPRFARAPTRSKPMTP